MGIGGLYGDAGSDEERFKVCQPSIVLCVLDTFSRVH